MSSNDKPIEIVYRCYKCKEFVNPEHFFCSRCLIQYKIGVSP